MHGMQAKLLHLPLKAPPGVADASMVGPPGPAVAAHG